MEIEKKKWSSFFHRVLAIWKREFSVPVGSETAGVWDLTQALTSKQECIFRTRLKF